MTGRLGDLRPFVIVASLMSVAALVPLFVNDYLLQVLTVSFYYVVLAVSWNLLAGYTGQFSLAQQAFATIGAYTTGMLAHYFHVPTAVGIAAAALLSGVVGVILGVMVLRLRAIYLAIATWGFAETLRISLAAAYDLTRGDLGLSVPTLLGNLDPAPYYYIFLGLAAGCTLIVYLVVRSPIGFFLRAIKDDELRAASMGINTTLWKVFAFALTSFLSGVAGAFYAHYVAVISPQIADFTEMAKIIVMVIVGGIGTFAGPLVGAPVVQVVSSFLHEYGQWSNVIFSLLVIVLMRTYRDGGVALALHAFRWLRARAAPMRANG